MTTNKIEIQIDAKDKASPALKDVASAMGSIDPVAKRAKAALDEIGRQQEAIEAMRKLGAQGRELGLRLNASVAEVERLGAALPAVSGASQELARAQQQAKDEIRSARAQIKAMQQALDEQTSSTDKAARGTTEYKTSVAQARSTINELKQQLTSKREALSKSTDAAIEAAAEEIKLQRAYEAAVSAAGKASAAVGSNRRAMDSAREGAQRLGVDVSKLASEKMRLDAAAKKVSAALNSTNAAAAKTEQSLRGVEQNAQKAGFELNKVAGAVAGAFAVDRLIDYGKSINEIADEYKNLESRVRLAVGPHADLQAAVQGVADVATRTYSSLGGTEALYSRLAASAKELKISNAEALGLTETINQAIQVSGASAQASEASVRQLVQGLQSGVLRGDEFNSVMEQAPRLARALADGLGVPVGKLREMAEAGELTSARIVGALKGQTDAINTEFATLPLTTGRAIEKLNTQWMLFIGNLSGGAKESSVVAQGISKLADNLDEIAAVAERAGTVLTVALAVKAAAALRAYAAEVLAAKTATSLLALEMSKVPTAINITVGIVGLEAGYQFGTWMRENTETARRFGVELVAMFERGANSAIFLKEAVAAAFNDDSVGAAYERFQQRAIKLEQTLQTMREDAKKAPAEWQAEADAAAKKMDGVGTAAQAAGTKVAEAGTQGATGLGEIKGATDGAKSALSDLDKLAAGINLGDSIGIAKAGKELRELLNTGKITADQFSDAWSKALAKNPDLVKFEQDSKAAFTGVEGGARLLSDAMDASLREAIRRSGQDFELLSGGMGKAAQSAINDADLIIGNLEALRAKGVDTGKALGASLSKAVNTADGQKSVDELRKRIEVMRAQLGDKIADGLLSDLQKQAEKLGATFSSLPAKAKSVAERTAEAFKAMGIQTQAELSSAATQAEQNYELIRASGQATADGLKQAWQQMAEAQIAANGGVASEALKAEAAMHGLEVQVDETGKAIVRSMDDGAKAVEGFAKGVQQAQEQLKRLKEVQGLAGAGGDLSGLSTEELQKAQADLLKEGGALSSPEYIKLRNELMGRGAPKTDKDGFTLDKNGGRLAMGGDLTTLTGIKNFLQQAGLDEEQAKKVATEFSDGKGNIPYFSNPGQKKYGGEFSTISDALLKAAERTTFGMGSIGASAVGGQQGGHGGRGPEPRSSRHVVEFKNAGRSRSFEAASASDASVAASLLRELGAAKSRS